MTVRMVSAYILYYVGFFGFIAYVLISYAAKNRMAAYIFARDLEVHSKIIPCRISWLRDALGLVLLSLIVIGMAVERQEYTAIIFVVLVYTFLGTLMFKDSCTHLDLDADYISITMFRKKIQYLRSEIHTIKWRDCRGITGKQLVIVFSDGKSYFFNMDHYRGVQNTYNELTG